MGFRAKAVKMFSGSKIKTATKFKLVTCFRRMKENYEEGRQFIQKYQYRFTVEQIVDMVLTEMIIPVNWSSYVERLQGVTSPSGSPNITNRSTMENNNNNDNRRNSTADNNNNSPSNNRHTTPNGNTSPSSSANASPEILVMDGTIMDKFSKNSSDQSELTATVHTLRKTTNTHDILLLIRQMYLAQSNGTIEETEMTVFVLLDKLRTFRKEKRVQEEIVDMLGHIATTLWEILTTASPTASPTRKRSNSLSALPSFLSGSSEDSSNDNPTQQLLFKVKMVLINLLSDDVSESVRMKASRILARFRNTIEKGRDDRHDEYDSTNDRARRQQQVITIINTQSNSNSTSAIGERYRNIPLDDEEEEERDEAESNSRTNSYSNSNSNSNSLMDDEEEEERPKKDKPKRAQVRFAVVEEEQEEEEEKEEKDEEEEEEEE